MVTDYGLFQTVSNPSHTQHWAANREKSKSEYPPLEPPKKSTTRSPWIWNPRRRVIQLRLPSKTKSVGISFDVDGVDHHAVQYECDQTHARKTQNLAKCQS
jgi:hypothetical protein